MRSGWTILGCVLSLLFAGAPCLADKRTAFIVGNAAYAHLPPAPKAAGDARVLGDLLTAAGFDFVQVHRDLDRERMRSALREFAFRSAGADAIVVIFTGHGLEADGPFLLPVDADPKTADDLAGQALSVDEIMEILPPIKGPVVLIADAGRERRLPMKESSRDPAARRAAQRVSAQRPQAESILFGFATAPGRAVVDVEGEHSALTAALLKHLTTPALDVRSMWGRVRDDVAKATNGGQAPAVFGSLKSDPVLLVPRQRAVEEKLPRNPHSPIDIPRQ